MKTPPIDAVLRNLRTARRRLSIQAFLTALARTGLLAGAVLLVLGAINRWLLDRLPFDLIAAGIAGGATLLIAVISTVLRRRNLTETAGIIDRLGGTRDRFLTALEFSNQNETAEPMRDIAVQECVRFVQAGNFTRLIPVRLPREIAIWLVPAVALTLLQWEARDTFGARDAQASAGRAAVEETAKKLEALARQATKDAEAAKSDELKKLAEQLKRGAEQLRADAKSPDEAAKASLRELSALEQLVQEMQKSSGGLTPEEMKALAKALAENPATKDAAEAMEKGDAAKAAEELEKAMQRLADQKDEQTPEQIKKTLEEAMKRLAEQKQLSDALQKLAQQMQRSAAEQGGSSSEAAKQLAQMLRQMAQGKSGKMQGNQSPGAQAMQNLLSALENMKFGDGQGGQPGDDAQSGQTPGAVMMQNFAKDGQGAMPGSGDNLPPSGQAGSDHDTGTTDTPFGKQNAAGKDAKAEQIAGRQGEGESLQQALTSAGDHSKSHRGYKDLYNAMAPAAQDAVLQENIPLGSRFFIKRYFEAIRPQE